METGILQGGLITGKERKTDFMRRKSLVDLEGVFLWEGCWRETRGGVVGNWSGATALEDGGGGGGGRLGVGGLSFGVGIVEIGFNLLVFCGCVLYMEVLIFEMFVVGVYMSLPKLWKARF